MLVPVPPEHGAEEGGAGWENDFVGLQLLIITGKSDIEEVLVFTKLTEGATEQISWGVILYWSTNYGRLCKFVYVPTTLNRFYVF